MEDPSAPAAADGETTDDARLFEQDLAEHVLLRSRINVLHPNPQSILDGLQVGFVNVSTGNLTFARRDIVVPARRRVAFSRIHDSTIRANADFGPGWRMSLDEAIIVDDDGAWYVDGAGARYRFGRGSGADFVPDPMMPRLSGANLTVAGTGAVLVSADGDTRTFERAEGTLFALRRIEWPGGDWLGLSHRDGRLDKVFDADGEILRLERDAHGRVAAVADRYRRHVEYGYDPRGRLARVRDLAGNYWSHEYDAADRLTAALGVDGEPYLTVGYDPSGRVALSVGERPFAFEYERDFTAVADRLSGERNVFQRAANGAVVGFSSTSGIAWQIDLDDAGRVGTLSMSDAAARLADDGPDAFRPADVVPEDRRSGVPWSRVIRFGYSPGGIATTEVASAAGVERRDYRYDDQGRLTLSWSSTDGIPPLQVDYRDGTVLRSGSDTVFEYRTGPYGAVLVGNGRTSIAVERDRRGDVLAFRNGTGAAFFARDELSRIVAVRHNDGAGARYFLDDLGHRMFAEYDHERLRLVVDPGGNVVASESVDANGRRRWTAARIGAGNRLLELFDAGRLSAAIRHDAAGNPVEMFTGQEASGAERGLRIVRSVSAVMDIYGSDAAVWRQQSKDRLDQLGVLNWSGSNAVKPDYGVVDFSEPAFAPALRDPLRAGVPGLAEALAVAHVAAGLLAGPDDPVRAAFESVGSPSFRPPEYRHSNSLPKGRLVTGSLATMSVPEVRVVGTRIPVVGYMTDYCLDDGWDFQTVSEACNSGAVFSYTRPGVGDLECTPCPTGGGGGGGGGARGGGTGGGDEDDEGDDSDDADDCGGITAIVAPSPDPAGLDTGNLTAGTQAALRCLRREVSENGGSLTVHSAYRSQAYQDHLREVWDKYQTVSGWAEGRCPAVRDNVRAEWERHDLAYRPAAQSQHSTGRAFDASWGVLDQGVDIDDLARECSLSRPVPGDPSHFLH